MILIYRFLLFPVIFVAAHVVALVNPKVREGLRLRGQPLPARPPGSPRPIWIHAASGEFEYAKPVIGVLQQRCPEIPILVTYFSPSFKKAIDQFSGVTMRCALPWDSVGHVRAFLDRFQPQILLIARTDIWPELVYQSRQRQIPCWLFSATLSETGKKLKSPLNRIWARWTLGLLNRIFCVSCEDRSQFQQLLNLPISLDGQAQDPQIEVLGDTRYDQVQARLNNPRQLKNELRPQDSKNVFVAGSTWPEDETELLTAYKTLPEKQGPEQWILVPHEPTEAHLRSLENQIREIGAKSQRYSMANRWEDGSILLVDQMGILAELYQWGAWAFVGGAFKGSVHSVMEPLAAGAFTFFGPHHRNNREAIEFQKILFEGLPVAQSVSSGAHLAQDILLRTPKPDWKAFIRGEIQSRSGASQKLSEKLSEILKLSR